MVLTIFGAETSYCFSLARTRIYQTPVAAISVHHIPASFFFGYAARGEQHVMMALPEKALLDFLYLAQRNPVFSQPYLRSNFHPNSESKLPVQ